MNVTTGVNVVLVTLGDELMSQNDQTRYAMQQLVQATKGALPQVKDPNMNADQNRLKNDDYGVNINHTETRIAHAAAQTDFGLYMNKLLEKEQDLEELKRWYKYWEYQWYKETWPFNAVKEFATISITLKEYLLKKGIRLLQNNSL